MPTNGAVQVERGGGSVTSRVQFGLEFEFDFGL